MPKKSKQPDEPELVKMSVLSERCGVPAPTIKHYIREGLLPPPAVRTSRNMAYYDAALVPRIQAIKELQRARFLPLKMIKDILDGAEAAPDDRTTVEVIARVIQEVGPTSKLRRTQILESGFDGAELDWLESNGFVSSSKESGEPVYSGDDITLIQSILDMRGAGITGEMLPISSLLEYGKWVRALVKKELALFRSQVMPLAGANLPAVAEASMKLSEQLVIVLKRRHMLQTMAEILEEQSEN